MVNFVVVVDPDNERRTNYVKKIESLLAPVEGLIVSSCTSEDFCATWASGIWTPVSYITDGKGAAVVFGDAIEGTGSERLNAEQLRRLWNGPDMPHALDGYHAAIVYSPQKGLMIGADLLGLFPIYYYVSEEIVLAGTSAELFRHHPCFNLQLNPAGLAGVFLTRGLIDNQTMLCGVKRLNAAHILTCQLGQEAKEVLQFKLPVSTRYFDLKLSEQVEVMDQALDEAVSRHLPKGEKYCMMLSAGHDSRLLAGYLKRKGLDVIALTDGLPTDTEAKSAALIARTLGFKHSLYDLPYSNYAHSADLAATWEIPSEGFVVIRGWSTYPKLQGFANRAIAGYAGGEILGDSLSRACPKPDQPPSSGTLLKNFNTGSFIPETVRRLLKRHQSGDPISDTLQRVKKAYEELSGHEFQRIWGFHLRHVMRRSLGCTVWLLSFASWPVLPYEDRKVIETAGGMPLAALINRNLQNELLRRKFPTLATIPFSTMTFDTTPLIPTTRQRMAQLIYGDRGIWKFSNMRRLRDALIPLLRGETRYWPRTYNFNSPGWKAIRKKADPHLKLTFPFLNENTVQKLMPSYDVTGLRLKWRMASTGAMETSGLKTIIGLALWMNRHPEATNSLQVVSGNKSLKIN